MAPVGTALDSPALDRKKWRRKLGSYKSISSDINEKMVYILSNYFTPGLHNNYNI